MSRTSKEPKIDPKLSGHGQADEGPEDARKIAGEAEARTPRVAPNADRKDRLRGPERDQPPARNEGKTRKGYDGL